MPAVTTQGLDPSFGFGDRLGVATPGHVAALRASGRGIRPIFAQQSIREMMRTGRTPEQVIGDAFAGAAAAGYNGPMGADADHLKTPADVDRTAKAGFRFFTIDPSEHADGQADRCNELALKQKFTNVREHAGWIQQYRGTNVKLPTGTTVAFDEQVLMRAAVKYGRAIRPCDRNGAPRQFCNDRDR